MILRAALGILIPCLAEAATIQSTLSGATGSYNCSQLGTSSASCQTPDGLFSADVVTSQSSMQVRAYARDGGYGTATSSIMGTSLLLGPGTYGYGVLSL